MTQNINMESHITEDHYHGFDSIYIEKDGHTCSLCGRNIMKINGKYKQELPQGVELQLDSYLERINKIKWFRPSLNLKRKDIDEQIRKIFKAFNVNGSIEYRQLKNIKDGADAMNIVREATWKSFINTTDNTISRYIQDAGWWDAYNVGFRIINGVCICPSGVDKAISGEIPVSSYVKKSNWLNTISAVFHSSRNAILDREYQHYSWKAVNCAMNYAKNDIQSGFGDILASNSDVYKEKYPNGNFINIIPLWEVGLYPIGMVNGSYVVYVPSVDGEFPEELK